MRKFITSPFGDEVDLDDPSTYNYLPNTKKELEDYMFSEIGKALWYMDFIYPDIFSSTRDGGQRQRVVKLIEDFTEGRKLNPTIMWYKEQIFLFQNETENMC